jgi:hypothetical protein
MGPIQSSAFVVAKKILMRARRLTNLILYNMERDLYMVYERKIEGNYLDCHKGISIMSYQPRPFSFVLLKVPAHWSDVEIRQLMMYRVRCIQIEPCDAPILGDNTLLYTALYNRVVVHFDDYPDNESRTKIQSGFYSTIDMVWRLSDMAGYLNNNGVYNTGNLILRTHVLPYNSEQPPPSEYSHTVALQLQNIVRKQAEHIERLKASNVYLQDNQTGQANRIQNLESRLNEMETRIHEGTELYMDINKSSMDAFRRMKSKLRYHKTYIKRLEANITALQSKEKDELKQQIDALTEWCSQPLWKRSSAFVMPEESNCDFISEF